jgi:hypothetical protein
LILLEEARRLRKDGALFYGCGETAGWQPALWSDAGPYADKTRLPWHDDAYNRISHLLE